MSESRFQDQKNLEENTFGRYIFNKLDVVILEMLGFHCRKGSNIVELVVCYDLSYIFCCTSNLRL